MSARMGAGAGMVGTDMGAFGDTYAVYNLFQGLYHPDYLSQNWVPLSMTGISNGTSKALPFSGVDNINREVGSNTSPQTSSAANVSDNNANAAANTTSNSNVTGHIAKHQRLVHEH